MKLFCIYPDLIEAVGPYPYAPNLPKCVYFYTKPNEVFQLAQIS